MNILRFVNSKDIRKYLADIDYKFSPLEAAWLIFQCNDATIREKHAAWKEIICTTPDCAVPEGGFTAPRESLHAFLKKHMELEDKYIKEFMDSKHADTFSDEKPYVYRFVYFYKDGSVHEWETVFSQFDAIFENIMEPDPDVVRIKCIRSQIDGCYADTQAAYLNPELELLSIDVGNIPNDEMDDYWMIFESMWFEFPTPFKKGDILWNPNDPVTNCCCGPFVNEGICLEGITSKQAKENIRKNGDNTDMTAAGYFLDEKAGIYHEVMHNYMDLEYYDKELTGSQRVLIPLSNYLKGEIDAGLYARAYHQIMLECTAEACRPLDYTKAGMVLAGLERKDEE